MQETFINFAKNVTTIEDLLAIAYGFIYQDYNSKKVRAYKVNDCKEIEGLIYNYFRQSKYDPSGALLYVVEKLILAFRKKPFGFNEYYCIIKSIDKNYRYVSSSGFNCENIKEYKSLSKISDDPLIIILPRIKNTYIDVFNSQLKKYEMEILGFNERKCGLRPERDFDDNSINRRLKNIIILHKEEIEENSILVHELVEQKHNPHDWAQNVLSKGALTVSVIPLSKHAFDDVFVKNCDQNYFWIGGIKSKHERLLTKNYISAINQAQQEDIDIVVFPEMYLNENILQSIEEYLKSHSDYMHPQIYILGSIWDCSNCSNRAVVMMSDGQKMFSQYKRTAFTIRGLEEKLLHDDGIIHILDVPKFARINIFICKDVIDGKLMSLPQILSTDLVVAPAFSSSTDMNSRAKLLAEEQFCTSIIANACSPRIDDNTIEQNKHIGFVCQPCKNDTMRGATISFYDFDRMCEHCNNNCTGYTIKIQFDNISDIQNKTFETTVLKHP